MANTRITRQACEHAMQAAELLGEPIKLFDDKLTGFGFRAAPRGEKASSFFCEYRLKSRGSAKQRFTLGKLVELTPADARALAQQFLGDIAKGKDVQAEKTADKARAAGMKFDELWAAYFDFRDDGSRYWRDIRGVYRREVPAPLANRAAELLTTAELRRMLDLTRQKSPNLERWVYEQLSCIFRWAIERGHMTANPATGLTPPAPTVRRDRVLSQAELAIVLKTVDGLSYPWRPFYLLLILTAARRDEVAGMRWAEMDLEGALWSLPGARTKNGRPHALELPEMAVRLLQSLPS